MFRLLLVGLNSSSIRTDFREIILEAAPTAKRAKVFFTYEHGQPCALLKHPLVRLTRSPLSNKVDATYTSLPEPPACPPPPLLESLPPVRDAKGSKKNCGVDGCAKISIGASGLCKAHGGGRRCQNDGCNKSAISTSDFCTAHGGGDLNSTVEVSIGWRPTLIT